MMLRRRPTAIRRGLSLMEVLVALAIFLGAMVVIGRLIIMGGERALEVQLQSEAARLCQSQMAKVVAGIESLTSQSDLAMEDDSDWKWSMECEQGNITGLWSVTVRVYKDRVDGSKVEASLSQLVLDPSMRGSTFDAALIAGSDTTTGTDSSSSSTTTGK
jgi:general secretion pathway protein I